MDAKLIKWRAAGKHLPPFFRDFHNQKAVFKGMHELVQMPESDIGGKITWVEGHCYVIDRFLWFMARHGYTLQRSRANQNFDSLDDNLAVLEKERTASLQKMLAGTGPDSQLNPDDGS